MSYDNEIDVNNIEFVSDICRELRKKWETLKNFRFNIEDDIIIEAHKQFLKRGGCEKCYGRRTYYDNITVNNIRESIKLECPKCIDKPDVGVSIKADPALRAKIINAATYSLIKKEEKAAEIWRNTFHLMNFKMGDLFYVHGGRKLKNKIVRLIDINYARNRDMNHYVLKDEKTNKTAQIKMENMKLIMDNKRKELLKSILERY